MKTMQTTEFGINGIHDLSRGQRNRIWILKNLKMSDYGLPYVGGYILYGCILCKYRVNIK